MGTRAHRRRADGRQIIESAHGMGELIISAQGWSREAEAEHGLDAIIAGEIMADRYIIATADGRGMIREWATESCGREIYYERWEQGACIAHGWLDAESRRIAQTG